MCRIGLVGLLVCMASLVAPPARAQATGVAPPSLGTGTRVRVSTAHRRDPITGLVASHSADTLVVRSDGDTARIALHTAQVSRVEVSRGRRTQKLKGATIGFLGGAGIGALAGLATYERTPYCGGLCDFGPGFDAVVGATLLGSIGALAGTLVGSRERERWRLASGNLGGDARLGIVPAGSGVALTASLTF